MKRVTLSFEDDEQAEKFAAMVRLSSAVTIPKYGNRATILQVLVEPDSPQRWFAERIFEDAHNAMQAGHPADQGALLTGILDQLLAIRELLTPTEPRTEYKAVDMTDVASRISLKAAEILHNLRNPVTDV